MSARRSLQEPSGPAQPLPCGQAPFPETKGLKMIGSVMMCVSTLVFLFGMFAGIAMGIAQNFQLATAHAHLNLIGGVMLFLFGLYYRLVPAAGGSRLAAIQGMLHIAGALVFPLGIALVLLYGHAYEAAPIVGSFVVIAAVALFSWIVFRTARG